MRESLERKESAGQQQCEPQTLESYRVHLEGSWSRLGLSC